MADWKYVIFKDPKTGAETPILFPGNLTHSDVVEYLWPIFPDDKGLTRTNVVSAGFIPALQIINAEGSSESLNIHSRPQDAAIINLMPYAHGLPNSVPNIELLMGSRFITMLMDKLKKEATR